MNGIVAGYDGSPDSDRALRWAVLEARARGMTLTVCSVWDLALPGETPAHEAARRHGADVLSRGLGYARSVLGADDGVVVPALVRGSPAHVLCEQSAAAEIVVVGSRGLGGVRGLLIGSVPWQVASHARGPVVVVRGQRWPANASPGPVVAGADGSGASRAAVTFACREAELRGVPLVSVCAMADAPAVLGGARRLEEEFSRMMTEIEKEHPDLTVLRQVSPGSGRAELLRAATGAQLLVIGSRGRGGIDGMALGSVAQAVLQHSPCPVGVVRAA